MATVSPEAALPSGQYEPTSPEQLGQQASPTLSPGWFSRTFGPDMFPGGLSEEYIRTMSRTVAETEGIGLGEAAELMESRGYACPARRFTDQVEDLTRTNRFKFNLKDYQGSKGVLTEHEGLVQLRDFLVRNASLEAQEAKLKRGQYYADLSTMRAKGMLENLTFIGEKEYAEAAEGLAAYWKRHLDSDPEAQLGVFALISAGWRETKSDRHLLERVLGHFSRKELKHYAGRLLMQPERMTAPVDKARIVLLDDWVISGQQMRGAYHRLGEEFTGLNEYIRADRVEINVITASERRLNSGLGSLGYLGESFPVLPVKAYFRAHSAEDSSSCSENSAHISGTHSTVDYDFRETLHYLPDTIYSPDAPAVVAITRPYRSYRRPNYRRTKRLAS